MRKGSLQPELNGAVVGCRQFVGRRHQGAGERNAYRKAADACHDILRQHRLVVVKTQPIAQAQQPSQPVIVDLMPLDHLRLRLPARIEAVQRVKHQVGVITSLTVEGYDRVEHDEIQARRDDQRLGRRRSADAWRGQRRSGPDARLQQIPSAHWRFLPLRSVRWQSSMPVSMTSFPDGLLFSLALFRGRLSCESISAFKDYHIEYDY